jgi:hypothetical protein
MQPSPKRSLQSVHVDESEAYRKSGQKVVHSLASRLEQALQLELMKYYPYVQAAAAELMVQLEFVKIKVLHVEVEH